MILDLGTVVAIVAGTLGGVTVVGGIEWLEDRLSKKQTCKGSKIMAADVGHMTSYPWIGIRDGTGGWHQSYSVPEQRRKTDEEVQLSQLVTAPARSSSNAIMIRGHTFFFIDGSGQQYDWVSFGHTQKLENVNEILSRSVHWKNGSGRLLRELKRHVEFSGNTSFRTGYENFLKAVKEYFT